MHSLENYILENNLNLAELADILGYDTGNLSRVINGKLGVSKKLAFKIKMLGKTDQRIVPICDELFEMINELNIDVNPLNYYLIGKDGIIDKFQHSENYFSRIFRRDIRTKLGLSDNYTLYGFKHTRVIHLISAGFSDSEVMEQTGHRDTASYDKYKRDLIGNTNSKMTGETVRF